MYTISQIRRRIDALKRKYAADLTIIRLRPLAEEYCLLWTESRSEGSNPPDSYAFIRHIARQGFRLNTFTALHLYLERCRKGGNNPNTIGIVASLLPQVRPARLEELLLSDTADAESAPGRPLAAGETPASLVNWLPNRLWNPRAVANLFSGLLNRHTAPRPRHTAPRPRHTALRPRHTGPRPRHTAPRPRHTGESRYPAAPTPGNLHNPEPALSATDPRPNARRPLFPIATLHPRPPPPAL